MLSAALADDLRFVLVRRALDLVFVRRALDTSYTVVRAGVKSSVGDTQLGNLPRNEAQNLRMIDKSLVLAGLD